MALKLDPAHMKRYARIGRLLTRYGRSDLVRLAGLDEVVADTDEAAAGATPEAEQLARDLEELGPTYIKLGQLLSSRVDLIPVSYTEALARLQDDVEPFPFATVAEIVESELGVRMSRAFDRFDEEPIAAASLGQVHRARLRDGREVAVKVQRPGVRQTVVDDMAALEELAAFLDRHTETGRRYDFSDIAAEMRRSLLRELDYREEAGNLDTLGRNLLEFDRLVVPRAVHDYSTARILTMDLVHGRKITSISPLARLEIDGSALADELFRAYLKQILVDGFFHADPHPGNVFLTDDGRVALLDVGMVGRLTPGLQDELLRLLITISEGKAEDATELLIRLGEPLDDFDSAAFGSRVVELVGRYHNAPAGRLQIGRVMLEASRGAADAGLRLPTQLTLLGKTLLNLDQVGRTLDPDFDPNAAVRRHVGDIMQRRMIQSASPGNVFANMLEATEFAQRLPARLNRVLDAIADREVEVRVRLMNEAMMMQGLQKVANRITMGLVIAALILGAALMMDVESSARILGYPALAIVLFLFAAVAGIALLFDIVRHDWRGRRD